MPSASGDDASTTTDVGGRSDESAAASRPEHGDTVESERMDVMPYGRRRSYRAL